jgi:cytidine deaminase
MSLTQEMKVSLLAHARQAASLAYAPYSHFQVGAALLLGNGEVVTGCNIENGSYGLTLCAERVALVKAVSEGARDFVAIAVWGEQCDHGAITPCGACRQVMAELMAPQASVIMSEPHSGALIESSVTQLLPAGFALNRKDNNAPNDPLPRS